jgi:hypothetical protein
MAYVQTAVYALVLFCGAALPPFQGRTQSLAAEGFLVRYALIMNGKSPLLMEQKCERGKYCRLAVGSNEELEIILIRSRDDRTLDQLKVDCKEFGCSFDNGRSSVYFGNSSYGKEFTITDEEPTLRMEDLLITRYRSVIGKIYIKY